MFHSTEIALPEYDTLEKFEGKGNWAIKKYYKWPWSFFYKKKLKMIVDLLPIKVQYNILDLGAGPGIFTKELKKHCVRLKSVDGVHEVDPSWKFDVVICSSYLEFVNNEFAMIVIDSVLKYNGILIVGSPMRNKLTDIYFNLLGDTHYRASHNSIKEAVAKRFQIEEYNTWLNLYFAIRARKL